METVTRFAERQAASVSTMPTSGPEVARTLSVTATYLLSEDGRKASLLAGGNGHAVQQIALDVPANRLHLVSVDKHGVARLKLRPRFEMDSERGIARIDIAPIYDAPPTIDDLYRAAAKNHELESAYYAARAAQRSNRTDAERELRENVASSFLADKGQRAIAHPPPSTKRCYVITERGRLLFDVETDQGIAKEVPAEAHRRFRADLREREERNRQDRAAQLALHDEKKRFIADWIAENGTDEQKVRQASGVLPIDEAVEAITDQLFSGNGHLPLYTRDGAERLQQFLRESAGLVDAVVAPGEVSVRSFNAVKATASQWAVVQELEKHVPGANVVLRQHVLSSKSHYNAGALTVFGVLVTKKHGPFMLRREYVVEDSTQASVAS